MLDKESVTNGGWFLNLSIPTSYLKRFIIDIINSKNVSFFMEVIFLRLSLIA